MSSFPRDHNEVPFRPDPDPLFDLRMAAIHVMMDLVAVIGSMVFPQIL